MRLLYAFGAVCALMLSLSAQAESDTEKKARLERAGNCRDAQSQMDYFCNASNSGSDTMVAIGTACENAKKNRAAACEGADEPDQVYKFDK